MTNHQQIPAHLNYDIEEVPCTPDYTSNENLDPEAAIIKNSDFSEKKIRLGFIRKVYGILLVQLAITGGIIFLFTLEQHVKEYVACYTMEFVLPPLVGMLVTLFALICCGDARKRSPCNYILLFAFTISMALLLGATTSNVEPRILLVAVGITAAICLGLTLFSFQTKWDFTLCGGWLLCFLIVFTMFGCFSLYCFLRNENVLLLLYASLGVLLFSFYLVYDTQLIIGGNHRYSISPEEYVFAALILYLDVIRIFVYILRILRLAHIR
ncbi:protein lifeguard 1-like [Euwallacea similis]|uniref:protein lifeguard 1-like n=1 Tax=Euwallacea similis TaxID=1736056 RepID=UPI00344C0C5E